MGWFTFLELGRVDVEKLGDSTSVAKFFNQCVIVFIMDFFLLVLFRARLIGFMELLSKLVKAHRLAKGR